VQALTLILAAAVLALTAEAVDAQKFRLGAPITDFSLRDMNGRTVNYSTLKGRVTVVMFLSTRCPTSNVFNYRRNTLYQEFTGRVKFIVVDSNANESLEELREYAHAVEFDFKDVNNVVADLFNARLTTDTYAMDSSVVIQYHGYLEDSPNPTRTRKQSLRLAIEAMLEGKPVAIPETRALGCAIRRAQS
jgi:hypothetical protein